MKHGDVARNYPWDVVERHAFPKDSQNSFHSKTMKTRFKSIVGKAPDTSI